MALKLDNNLLEELGLGALPDGEKQLLLRQIYEKLEMNVGVRLADQMTNEQLDEFEKFVDSNDDKGAFQWLEANFPNYKDVVNAEFEKLKAEIKQYAPQMLAVAAHNNAQAQTQQMAPAQPQSQYGPVQQPGPQAQPGQFDQSQYGQQYSQQYAQPQQSNPQAQPMQPGQSFGYPQQPAQYQPPFPNVGGPDASQQMPGQQYPHPPYPPQQPPAGPAQ
jgi:hypothetical protein